MTVLYALAVACSDDNVAQQGKEAPGDSGADTPEDTGRPQDSAHGGADTDDGVDTADTGADTGAPRTDEECNGADDDLDGMVDEGFDANGNGIPDCTETEAYCTPFDDFSAW